MTLAKPHKELRSPLGKARGMGPSGKGVAHWKLQRLTGMGLIPLSLWFMASVCRFKAQGWESVVQEIAAPFPVIALILLTGLGFYHSYLGLQVVIEDYVPHRGARFWILFLIQSVTLGGAISAWVALLMILIKGIHPA
jgi:succinate dehydrogenase / fumarate reductase membrane anchor subunit